MAAATGEGRANSICIREPVDDTYAFDFCRSLYAPIEAGRQISPRSAGRAAAGSTACRDWHIRGYETEQMRFGEVYVKRPSAGAIARGQRASASQAYDAVNGGRLQPDTPVPLCR